MDWIRVYLEKCRVKPNLDRTRVSFDFAHAHLLGVRETAYVRVKLTRIRPRFVFTRGFDIFQSEQNRVEPGLVLTRVEPGLVCAV